jgi:hypothetical protein
MIFEILTLAGIHLHSAQAAPKPQTSRTDWEFGQIHLGELHRRPPRKITGYRNCYRGRDWLHCAVTLGDGVWYDFDKGSLVAKSIDVRDRRRPWWINPNDNVVQCKRRLERLTGFRFRIFEDDYGNMQVETSDLVATRNGYYYNIHVHFKRGRMTEVEMTPLPHEDS